MSLFFYFYRKVCDGVERMRKYRVWLTAALVINLVVSEADEGVGGCSQAAVCDAGGNAGGALYSHEGCDGSGNGKGDKPGG